MARVLIYKVSGKAPNLPPTPKGGVYMLKTLYIGIDISHKTNIAQFMDQEGNLVHEPFEFPNNREGLEMFISQLNPILSSQHQLEVKIGPGQAY